MEKNIWIPGVLLLILSFIFDPEIMKFVYSLKYDLLISIMKIITEPLFLIVVLFFYFMILKNDKRILLIISLSIVFLITFFLKILIMRERPSGALITADNFSFPSMHASIIFSSLAIMCKEYAKFKWIFISIAAVIGLSRLYLGVHYASDIIFGALLGYGAGLLIMHRKVVYSRIYGVFRA